MSKHHYNAWKDNVPFDTLVGRRITKITGAEAGSDFVEFHCDDGTLFGMFHDQDCCESVDLHEFDGDPQRTIGLVTAAREETSTDRPALSEWDDSHTWTFYVLETEGGTLHLRWYGTSNGYYGEGVDFCVRTIQ